MTVREATPAEVDAALAAAEQAFADYRHLPPARRAAFLEAIGAELMALGPALIERAQAETALPAARPPLTSKASMPPETPDRN